MATIRPKPAPRLPRPAARYWKGKAPKGLTEVESDSDVDEAQEFKIQEDGDVQIRDIGDIEIVASGEEDEDMGIQVSKTRVDAKGKSISVALKDVSVSKEGKVIVAGRLESGKTEMEGQKESSEEESEDEEGQESEEESSEDDESESEEAPQPLFRPVFVPKRARATIAEKEALAEDSVEMQNKREQEAEERRKQSHDMVAESIRRELAEKKEDKVPDVDDTDGLDPSSEFEAWRLRELGRIKKEKEKELLREQEREEIEKRRALPEEQRHKEDVERADKTRAEKSKGQQKFLQKYWHKGAFHQDAEVLKRHDFTEATESTIDMTVLPKVMQVKNFGKRGRTKYTHLLDQDTTVGNGGFGGAAPVKQGGTGTDTGGCFLCGGPHLKKDCPQDSTKTGTNSTALGPRPWKDDRGPRDRTQQESRIREMDVSHNRKDERESVSMRHRYDRRDRYDNHRNHHNNQPSRSRSRSPSSFKDRHQRKERRRSRERSFEYREKRRRLD